jgi:hypothetical protein
LNFQSHAGGDCSNILCCRIGSARMPGLTRTATRLALGTRSWRSRNRLAVTSGDEKVDPG